VPPACPYLLGHAFDHSGLKARDSPSLGFHKEGSSILSIAATSETKTNERLNVNVSIKTSAALREISKTHGTTITETVRRAVSLLDLVEKAVENGGHVEIHEPGQKVKVIQFV
jgi:hypothetical protein